MERRKMKPSRFPCVSSPRVHLIPPQQRSLNALEAIQRGVERVGSVRLLMEASGAHMVPAGRH